MSLASASISAGILPSVTPAAHVAEGAEIGPGNTGISADWLWEALVSCRHAHSVVTNLAPTDFDWNGVHPVYGTPLMATVNEVVRSGQVNSEVKPVLQWCLRQGSDPRLFAANARGYSGGWGNGTEEFPTVPRVPHAGKCAITLVLALIIVLERISVYEYKGKYHDQLSAAKQLLSIFAQFRAEVPRRSVAEASVEMWERIQTDTEHADVELQATGAGPGTVQAHALVLCQASPVLRASLTSRMQEGQTRVLQVPDANVAAVELLLAIIYSGTLPAHAAPALAQSPRSDAAVGDKVEGNYQCRGRWWAARITAVYDDSTCDLVYEGDVYTESCVKPHRIRPCRSYKASQCAEKSSRSQPMMENAQVQLMTLDIAHRWQIGHAVALLEIALAQHLREGTQAGWFTATRDTAEDLRTFELLFEAAILKDLPTLRTSCKHFASEVQEVRRHHKHHGFGALVTRELQQLFD